jgi:hypothetical protein
MGKPHRGKGTRELFAHGRGECPICKRYNVKVLYEMEAGEQKFKICKTCKAAIKNGTKSLPASTTVTAKAEAPAAEEAETKTAAAEAPVEAATEEKAEE